MCTGYGMVGKPVKELDTPVLLVDLPRLESNIARTVSLLRERGVNWRPHAKGHKLPAIAHREVQAGAIGIACAKLEETVHSLPQEALPKSGFSLAGLIRQGQAQRIAARIAILRWVR